MIGNLASRLLYILMIQPVSLLPYGVLYRLSDTLFLLFYHVLGYRKKVIYGNIKRSFPQKSAQEHEQTCRSFYRHFCDLIVESIKIFSIKKSDVDARFKFKNPELLNQFYNSGRSVILAGGHFNNWELFAVAIDQAVDHSCKAVYKPLNNRFFDKIMRKSRGKYGLKMIPVSEVKSVFESSKAESTCYIFATDQSPGKAAKAYWTTFLNQDTAVLFGTEKYAVEYDYPVVYGCINKLKRGFYEVEFSVVCAEPSKTAYGEITEKHVSMLENDIRRAPEFWLWSHRRWKHRRPEKTL